MGQLKEGLAIATAATAAQFIHLRVRSAYSLLEGAIKAGKVATLAAAEAVAPEPVEIPARVSEQQARRQDDRPFEGGYLPVHNLRLERLLR